MRISILLIALTGILAFSPANAGKENGRSAEMAAAHDACKVLKGTTRGLHGLCTAYCAKRDLSQVDLNDTASIKAASSDISILRKYNERRRPADPEMPCFKNTDPPVEPPDDPPVDPPPASNCPCWTAEELAAIDGVLPPSDWGPAVKECTTEATKEQVAEGYQSMLLGLSAEGVAYAVVDPNPFEPYFACFYLRSGSPTVLFSVEQPDAEACMQEVVAQCAL